MRAKSKMASAVLEDDRSAAAVAAASSCTSNTCHDAIVATSDPVLDIEPEPVRMLGIDETRRGKARYETCQRTGKRVWSEGYNRMVKHVERIAFGFRLIWMSAVR
jgi:endonuclease YncB( thermonuclease family)